MKKHNRKKFSQSTIESMILFFSQKEQISIKLLSTSNFTNTNKGSFRKQQNYRYRQVCHENEALLYAQVCNAFSLIGNHPEPWNHHYKQAFCYRQCHDNRR